MSSTNTTPRPRNRSTIGRLWTISWYTYSGEPNNSRAVSRLSIAIFTPAQNPRGFARMIFIRVLPLRVSYPRPSTPPTAAAPRKTTNATRLGGVRVVLVWFGLLLRLDLRVLDRLLLVL